MNKKTLSERDICTKFITPAIEKSGWDKLTQLLEEVSFTDGKIYVRGKMTARGARKRADYILYYKPNIPIAIVEAKDNKHSVEQVFNKLWTMQKYWTFLVCSAATVTDLFSMTEPQLTVTLKLN